MAALDMSSANGLLKELYFGQTPPTMVYEDRPFMAMVKKMTNMEGKYVPVPTIWADGGSYDNFQLSQQNSVPLKAAEFLVTRARNYVPKTIANETIESMASDKGSFVRAITTVVEQGMNTSANSLSSALFRDGSGIVSTISTIGTPTAGIIVLADPNDIVQFDYGMVLQAISGGVPRAALGYVVGRSVTNGTITVSAAGQGGAAGNPAAWAASDGLCLQGNLGIRLVGLGGWIPAADPAAGENFFGVDRSVDTRLSGIRVPGGSSETITEALIDAATLVSREGGRPKFCVMPFSSWAALEKETVSKLQYITTKGPQGLNFTGLRLAGPKGEIDIFPDKDCLSKTAFLLTMESWTLYSLGMMPKIIRYTDGLEFLRVFDQDSAEVRIGWYGQLACNAPGFNARVSLPA